MGEGKVVLGVSGEFVFDIGFVSEADDLFYGLAVFEDDHGGDGADVVFGGDVGILVNV